MAKWRFVNCHFTTTEGRRFTLSYNTIKHDGNLWKEAYDRAKKETREGERIAEISILEPRYDHLY